MIATKFKSRRFLAALWAMILVSFIVFTGNVAFAGLATVLTGIIGVWIGAESVTKKAFIENNQKKEN